MLGFNDLEHAVLNKLLAGDHPVLEVLRQQFTQARLAKRVQTGKGFYCEIEVDADAPKVRTDFHLSDVDGDIEGLSHGAGFVLFVRDGCLSMLEGYAYDEPWPDTIRKFSLEYGEPERLAELSKLKRE